VKVVVDTNVLVSGLLRPHGVSAGVVRLISSGELRLCVDARILSEYEEVLARPKFAFDSERVGLLLDFVRHYGHAVAGATLPASLPDADDEPFLEAAIAGEAPFLVTGNAADFPESKREGVRVVSPGQFMTTYGKHKTRPSGRRRGQTG
jgi:putative PIN family toxin of toxin-antitoxin system